VSRTQSIELKETLLKITDLNKYFPLRSGITDLISFKTSKKRKVIDYLNLELKKGEILVIAGESGSGKTTLAKLSMR
jgi:peptide/nickel transport system ATP-binding protein